MTQTNQNKDYSWQWLDEIFDKWRGNMLTKGLGSPSAANATDEEAKAAIIARIDEHYIGKGEAKKHYEEGFSDGQDSLLRSGQSVPDLFTEQEVEQRCIEARVEELAWILQHKLLPDYPFTIREYLEQRKAELEQVK